MNGDAVSRRSNKHALNQSRFSSKVVNVNNTKQYMVYNATLYGRVKLISNGEFLLNVSRKIICISRTKDIIRPEFNHNHLISYA